MWAFCRLSSDRGDCLCRYMWNPLSWAMEVAAILAIILLDFPDFALILGLLIMNATISYREEASADKVCTHAVTFLAMRGSLAPLLPTSPPAWL